MTHSWFSCELLPFLVVYPCEGINLLSFKHHELAGDYKKDNLARSSALIFCGSQG